MISRREPSDLVVFPPASPQQNASLPPNFPNALTPGGMPGVDSGNEGGGSLWTLVDDRMRGRWLWAIGLGLVLAAVLGTLGYFSAKPLYRSVGTIRMTPQVPAVLHATEFHSQPFYEMARSTHMQNMKEDRVIVQALADEELAKLEWSRESGVIGRIRSNLNVERDRESELIYVWYEAEDPIVAQAVTNAVIRAYYEIHGRSNGHHVVMTLKELQDNEQTLVRELRGIQKERRELEHQYHTSDLRLLQQNNMQHMMDLERQIRMSKRELSRLARGQSTGQSETPSELAPEMRMLEEMNPMLAVRRAEWSKLQTDIDQIKGSHFPGSRVYETAKARADRAKELYDEEYQRTLDEWRQSGSRLVMTGGRAFTTEDVDELQTEFNKIAEQQRRLFNDIQRREDLVHSEQALLAKLDAIRNRISTLEMESKSLASFITINSLGGRDDAPHENARKKRAIMGAALGLFMSFGGFFLLGSIDRRTFGASQLAPKPGSRVPACLGVLPDLGASFNDPESSDVATHCVHQIRNQIEALRDPKPGYVLAVTSPFQGDGKTSICMALGWSYAAAGFKTLLIDCDLVGRSLTRQMGLIGREGMKDALAARELNGSISRMAVDNLSAVPAGIHPTFGPENVRRVDLQNLLEQVREQYDIILVDTGPLLGSLESTPVASAADGVLLSVRRGRSRSRLEDCVNRLDMMGAHCLGVVLNCAWRSDCYRYVSEASLAAADEGRAARPAHDGAVVHVPTGERNALVRAMQSSARSHRALR